MLFLKASADIETFDEYEGQKGQFIKTFALNDKRNKNGWRVTWQSIKKDIATFLQRPGIEFVKCEKDVCDLDHTEGATFEQSLEVQEPYRVTTIIDFTLDESTHTAYFIHRSENAEFYQKVKNGEIKYVSPSIWPSMGGFEILGAMENGLPIMDVYEWKGLHDAFVNNPAFGDDAKVTATCEGGGCAVRLLTAASLMGSECVQRCIEEKRRKGIEIDDQALAICYSECGESNKKASSTNNSLSGCGCSRSLEMPDSNQARSAKTAEEENKELKKENDELKAKLKAAVEENNKAKKAAAQDDDEEKEDGDGDDKEKKAPQAKKASTDSHVIAADNAALVAKIKSLEAEAARPLIAKMVEAREAAGMAEDGIEAFKASLKGKDFDAIKAMYDAEAVYHQAFKAKMEEREHFPFNGGDTEGGALSGKAYEIVFDDEEATA